MDIVSPFPVRAKSKKSRKSATSPRLAVATIVGKAAGEADDA
jgi:hypothetical protein